MGDKQYTLDQLVLRSGFGKRQIRYYITQKLVPGAGEQRGPNAVYGQETLDRLQMIALLKEQPTGPTGRTMTLAEIRHELDKGEDQNISPEVLMCCAPIQRIMDCSDPLAEIDQDDQVPPESQSSAIEYLQQNTAREDSTLYSKSRPATPEPEIDSELTDLLQSLQTLLTELGSDTQLPPKVSAGETWRRVHNTPDIEIQVRTPDTMEARRRLYRMAAQLGHLLAREE